MRKYILIGTILFPLSASAQEPKTYTFTVTPNELGVMAQGIGMMPYKDVAPLLKKLDDQLAAQNKPAEPVPAPKAEEPAK